MRLSLSTNSFKLFKHGTDHSIYPITLIVYNLPLWMYMKQLYFIMSLLIPNPTSSRNDIDLYLRPLIGELKELWTDGINTYDAYDDTNFYIRQRCYGP